MKSEYDAMRDIQHDIIPSALEMRRRIDQAQGRAAQEQLKDLAQKIQQATESGRVSIQVLKLEAGVRQALERKGYKVNYCSPDQRDPRDSAYYMISW